MIAFVPPEDKGTGWAERGKDEGPLPVPDILG